MNEKIGVKFFLKDNQPVTEEFITTKEDILLLMHLLREENDENDLLACDFLKYLIFNSKIDEATTLVYSLSAFPSSYEYKIHKAKNIAFKSIIQDGTVIWSIGFDYTGNTCTGYKFN